MKALIELFAATLFFVASWLYSLILTFGLRFLIVVLSGIFGWIIGWFFDETILSILAQLGITDCSMAQVGIFLGFIGCFFSPIVNYKTRQNEKTEEKQSITSKTTINRVERMFNL